MQTLIQIQTLTRKHITAMVDGQTVVDDLQAANWSVWYLTGTTMSTPSAGKILIDLLCPQELHQLVQGIKVGINCSLILSVRP